MLLTYIHNQRRKIFGMDRHNAKLHQMRVVWRVYGKHRLSSGECVLAQCLSFAAFFGVGDEDVVGERGDIGIALSSDCCGGATECGRQKRTESSSALRLTAPASFWGIRIRPSPRAGQTTTDVEPRNSKSKHSFSIGD